MLRIVVSFRRPTGEPSGGDAEAYLDRARQTASKAEALGAQLVAWGSTTTSFAFEPDAVDDAVALALGVIQLGRDRGEAWAVGVAEGELSTREGTPRLAWGAPLVAAEALASIARPGEIVVARDLGALRSRMLTPLGPRSGIDEERRVRGVAIDPAQPWRKDAEALVEKMVLPPYFGQDRLLPALACRGRVAVVLAEPGLGGSRALVELAAINAPAPSLLVRPGGARSEPLGALRAAFARFMVDHPERIGAELLPLLDRLLTGVGIDLTKACALVLATLRAENGGRAGALLVDQVIEIDDETLDACARAARAGDGIHFVVRSDATGELPGVLARLPRGNTVALTAFGTRDAEAFAAACLGGALDEAARVRWARRGGFTPLGIIEALAAGFTSGDLAWSHEVAVARRRFAGKGKACDATEWVRDRAGYLSVPERAMLTAIAVLGGRAPLATVRQLLEAVGQPVDLAAVRSSLVLRLWLLPAEDRLVALPSGTHARALLSRLDEDAAERWHAACAEVLAQESGVLALADAAQHAMNARDAQRASDLARTAGDVAAAAKLDDAATRLYAFARFASGEGPESEVPVSIVSEAMVDDSPTHERRLSAAMRAVAALEPPWPAEVDAGEIGTVPGVRAPAATIDRTLPSPPPAPPDNAPVEDAPDDTLSMRRDNGMLLNLTVARRQPLVSESIVTAVDGEADGDSEVFWRHATGSQRLPVPLSNSNVAAGRRAGVQAPMREAAAAARVVPKGATQKLAEILRLRAAKSRSESLAGRCQTSLALGVVLASVDRVEEALLEGLEALARAREDGNERGLEASLAFLAKLFARSARPDEARRISMAVRRPVDERLRPPY